MSGVVGGGFTTGIALSGSLSYFSNEYKSVALSKNEVLIFSGGNKQSIYEIEFDSIEELKEKLKNYSTLDSL